LPERIVAFKGLDAQALQALPVHRGGAIVDDRYGREALGRLTGTGRWIARPVELPGSRPLAYDFAREPALALRSWPVEHVATYLVSYRADDPQALRAEQAASLLALQRACHTTGRRFLLEVIPVGWEADPPPSRRPWSASTMRASSPLGGSCRRSRRLRPGSSSPESWRAATRTAPASWCWASTGPTRR
jgi:5-dehydro-2-deoxygluconokinase